MACWSKCPTDPVLEQQKTPVPYAKGQEFTSCGTTRFGLYRPTQPRTNMRVLLITGKIPVDSYCAALDCLRFAPPSQVHSILTTLSQSHHFTTL